MLLLLFLPPVLAQTYLSEPPVKLLIANLFGSLYPVACKGCVCVNKCPFLFKVYLSRYPTDRTFLQFTIATFDDMDTICWLRPDYVMQLLNIPIGLILLSNLTVLIAAVATAYRSATFRWHPVSSGLETFHQYEWFPFWRNTATLVKVTGAARNCVTLSCILGLGFLVCFQLLFLLITSQLANNRLGSSHAVSATS